MSELRREDFASFDGTRLVLHRYGEGPPVVLLHGLFSSAQMNWIKWGHHERIAAKGFEVVMLDFRIHGQSETPQGKDKYPPDVLLRDLAALVDHLGLEDQDYALGGFSLGARTTLHAVAKGVVSPQRLIIGGMGTAGLGEWQKRAAHFKRVIDEFDTMSREDPAWFSRQFLKSQGVNRTAARLLLDTMGDMSLDRLGDISQPTLVVCGDQDRDNGSAEELTAMLAHGQFVEVPGNHMMSATRPELGERIADWLAQSALD